MMYLAKTRRSGSAKRVAALVLTIATAATAASAADPQATDKRWLDIGASERVDFSGRLHMLSQRIAASTCNIEAGKQTDISKGILLGSTDELDRILHALRNGNPRMKIIGEESNPRVLSVLASVEEQWAPVRNSIQTKIEPRRQIEVIEQWDRPFFEDSNLLVSEIAAEYSNPTDLLQSDAILVDLAGRQRMRTQMLLKQGCEIWRDGATQEEQKALLETVSIFDRTLSALRFGAKDVGLTPAPTESIDSALTNFASDWDQAKNQLEKVAYGQSISDDEIGGLYLLLNDMLIQSDRVVSLYSQHAKRKHMR